MTALIRVLPAGHSHRDCRHDQLSCVSIIKETTDHADHRIHGKIAVLQITVSDPEWLIGDSDPGHRLSSFRRADLLVTVYRAFSRCGAGSTGAIASQVEAVEVWSIYWREIKVRHLISFLT